MCDLENIGQGHDVQHSHCQHSIALSFSIKAAVDLSSQYLTDIKCYEFQTIFHFENIGQGHDVQHSPFSLIDG